jgi:TolB protein
MRKLFILILLYGVGAEYSAETQIQSISDSTVKEEFRIWKIPNITNGAECYFSPDGKTIIYNGKEQDDSTFHVYTINIDGTNRKRINNKGSDACSYFNPDGKTLIWTSTKDNHDLPAGNFSDPQNYPQGAELYLSDLDGNNVKRLTNNKIYEAEVTYAPDGHKILFGRQINGEMDLWTMNPDGSDQKQITFTHDWQEGGALYMPDNKTIITRAWKKSEEGNRMKSMQLFTLNEDGSNLKQITFEEGTHWAPSPAPDGVHVLYVKLLPPHNFEIFLLNLSTMEEKRITNNPAFDGFPTISPDGKTVAFSSARANKHGERSLAIYLLDISSLHLGKGGK